MFRVIQTVPAFEYPEGKEWGPYAALCDAEQRVSTLRSFRGDGVIDEGEFGAPAVMREPVNVGGPSMARELADA